MASWVRKSIDYALSVFVVLPAIMVPLIVAPLIVMPLFVPSSAQAQDFFERTFPDGLTYYQATGDSFAKRFTTTIPLKQCEYPRLWSSRALPLLSALHQLQGSRSEISSAHPNDPSSTLSTLAPTKQATRLFHLISQHYKSLGYATPTELTVSNSEAANAFIRKKFEVVLTKGLLGRVTDDSELAFILAHELAHVALSHGLHGGIPAEVAADALALKVVTTLKFNPCSGSTVLEKLGSPAQLTLVSVAPRLTALHDRTLHKCG